MRARSYLPDTQLAVSRRITKMHRATMIRTRSEACAVSRLSFSYKEGRMRMRYL